MSKDAEYYENNPGEFDSLTDDEKDSVLSGNLIEDDTEADEAEENSETSGAEQEEPELLAKDGKHTIPYQELVEARKKAAEWEQFASQQADLIKSLQAAKVEDAGTGDTKAQEAVIAEYQGEFPEVVEDMKPFIQRMIDEGIKAGLSQFQTEINERVAPVEKIANETAAERYFSSIRAAHPDADEIVDDKAFSDWVNKQPSFVKASYMEALEYKRPASDLIEMFSAYKEAAGIKPSVVDEAAGIKPSVVDITGQAKDIIAKTKRTTGPGSLTDIPAGTTGQHDETEQMMTMTSRELEKKFWNKSPDEINKMMSKLL
jgi:hypothetical protein